MEVIVITDSQNYEELIPGAKKYVFIYSGSKVQPQISSVCLKHKYF